MKDIYLLNGKVVDDTKFYSFAYNDAQGNKVIPVLNDDDIGIHLGMSMHILTAGLFQAFAHGVSIPKVPGLARVSQAFFIQPMPTVVMEPPTDYEFPSVQKTDVGLINELAGFKQNWSPKMTYAEWNERLNNAYDRLFNFIPK
mmetsp:Transcript_5492/g.4175  ORF Transcript_5492/g.4175 Transcript_5492/m.4175 type:complete len:143 (+) Transcript_5492:585-1013(+)